MAFGEAKTVVIVGAGAAGLQAANILLESSPCTNGRLKVVILEARDRVGGRILIERRWGSPFDCGMCGSCVEV
jgi:monoamine oxidase